MMTRRRKSQTWLMFEPGWLELRITGNKVQGLYKEASLGKANMFNLEMCWRAYEDALVETKSITGSVTRRFEDGLGLHTWIKRKVL